jgi:curved DNA-binding protein CbpA
MVETTVELPPPTAEGTFARTPLVQVLVYVLERSLTGTLEVVRPDGPWATILMLDGYPSKGRTSEPVAYLGSVLREMGYIDDATLNASLATMARERKLHGQILLDSGQLSQEQLSEGLRAQLVKKIEHLFDWPPETRFAYYDSFDALTDFGADDVVELDPAPIVWSAVRTQPPWEHVQAALARVGTNALRLVATSQIERFGLNKEERGAVDLLRVTPMRVHDLVGTKILNASTTQLLLYCLLIAKQVEMVAGSGKKGDAPLARVNLAQVSQAPLRGVTEESGIYGDPRAPENTPYPAPVVTASSPKLPVAVARPAVSSSPKLPVSAVTVSSNPGAQITQLAQLDQKRTEVLARLKSIKSENYFEMLAVAKDATSEQVVAAFLALAKAWHPDRLPPAIGSDVRDACSTIFAHMNEAKETLVDLKRRDEYMHLLRDGGATPDEQAIVQAVLEAATNFQKAEFYLNRANMKEAEALCRKAFEADPKPPEYLAMLAWLEAIKPENQGEKETKERIAMFDKVIAQSERLERAYFYRGMLYKRLGNVHAAAKDFRQAADLNPRNVDALREVRLFEMRKGSGSIPPPPAEKAPNSARPGSQSQRPPPVAGGGIFGKLFKK